MTSVLPHPLVAALCGGTLALTFLATPAAAESLGTARFLPAPSMDLPDYLTTTVDPSLGTTFVRVTTPLEDLGAGVTCKRSYCTHRYSSAQAWNADHSLLVIVNGCGFCFLDGKTHVPVFKRQRSDDCEWHPTDPAIMICIGGSHILRWTPQSNATEIVFEAKTYRNLRFGPNKGNPSWDGNRVVVRATADDGSIVAFAYDLAKRHKFPDIPLARLPGQNSYCGISPLGTHIFCQQSLANSTDQAFVFDVEGHLLQSWTEHHRPGHGDMTVDDDGREVYVGISKSVPDRYQVIKRRLEDGLVTALTPRGEAQHASTRAIGRPGWVFLSYAGRVPALPIFAQRAPFIQEVIALRIDGSGVFRRIAHTLNAPHDYWSETHATPSPDGSQVIWSSNWNRPGGPVYDFITRIDWNQKD